MSNSSVVSMTKLSPNHSGKRKYNLRYIVPHCFVGQVTVEQGLNAFMSTSKQASCNYVIAKDGKVGLCVDEDNRSWCTSSGEIDHAGITIECASDSAEPYAFTPACYDKLIQLCVDICRAYGKTKLLWIEDKNKALAYTPKSDEMLLTVHRWFASKSCPGKWMYDHMGHLASTVTNELNKSTESSNKLYHVQVGAYKNKANADAMASKLKADGYDTYLVQY